MREIDADLFHVGAFAIVITTNGFIKKNGEAVMGAGVAKIAAKKWPRMAQALGQLLKSNGNHVFDLYKPENEPMVFTFPVKENWMDRADHGLIEQSANELVSIMDRSYPQDLRVALPRPGCGNGQLDWGGDAGVKRLISPILDDRFVVCYPVQNWSVFVDLSVPDRDPKTDKIKHTSEWIITGTQTGRLEASDSNSEQDMSGLSASSHDA